MIGPIVFVCISLGAAFLGMYYLIASHPLAEAVISAFLLSIISILALAVSFVGMIK